MPLTPPASIVAADEFTAGYQAIIDALVANGSFTSLVKTFNSFADGSREDILNRVNTGDLPEATLLNSTDILRPWGGNSREWEADQTYPLVIVTDTMQVNVIGQIKRAVMGALFHGDLESNAKLNGVNFVRNVTITGGGDGSSGIKLPTTGDGNDAARGVNRQGTLININLTLYGSRSSLPT